MLRRKGHGIWQALRDDQQTSGINDIMLETPTEEIDDAFHTVLASLAVVVPGDEEHLSVTGVRVKQLLRVCWQDKAVLTAMYEESWYRAPLHVIKWHKVVKVKMGQSFDATPDNRQHHF